MSSSIQLWRAVLLAAVVVACYPKGWSGMSPIFVTPSDFPFSIGPYVVLIDQGTVAVVVEHELTEPPIVEWWYEVGGADSGGPGLAAARDDMPTAEQPRRVLAEPREGLWVAMLRDLPLDDGLRYRVRSHIGDTPAIPFKAGASRGRPLRFAAIGDTRTGHHIHRALVEALARERVDFVVHSGDLVEPPMRRLPT